MQLRKSLTLLISALFLISLVLTPGKNSVNAQEGFEKNSCSTDRGLDVVFVMNDSSDMAKSDPMNTRIEETIQFSSSLEAYDRVSVIGFNTASSNLQSLTSNRILIDEAINSLTNPLGGSDMSKGIQAALDEFKTNNGNNHKIMVILTTGTSINNQVSLALAQQAYEENITIYTVGFGASGDIDRTILSQLAEKTGGSYSHAPNGIALQGMLQKIKIAAEDIREPKVFSDWTLTQDLHENGNLVLHENVKMDLNGYNLKVDGDLVLLSCAELRGINKRIQAENLEQKAGSVINLNNSQLEVRKVFIQDGFLRVNGDYRDSEPEILVKGAYNQRIRGGLDLNAWQMKVDGDFYQEGRIKFGGGTVTAGQDFTQKGFVDLEKGKLFVLGNLKINGGPLIDDEFKKNKSLNVNGGYVKVGSSESMALTSAIGNVVQESGQLYVNYGIVDIFGNYQIKDGWLTMIHATMDTTSESMMDDDGDYVHVYRDFSMESKRNHSERKYDYVVGSPSNDQAHLTNGILQVDGNFKQVGDKQADTKSSDRHHKYEKDFSRFNFAATDKHKVLLTGEKGNTIAMQGTGSIFNLLQLEGVLGDYQRTGTVRWGRLIETKKSANVNLKSLSIQDIPVHGFNPDKSDYYSHSVPSSSLIGPLKELKVDAIAEDSRNATVRVVGDTIGVDGTAQVRILVTANDGSTQKVYTVNVTVDGKTNGQVTSIEVNQKELLFSEESSTAFSPNQATIGYTVKPTNATDQNVSWMSTNTAVATVMNGIVTPRGVGEATIIVRTDDGGYTASVNVKVAKQSDVLAGIKTLADFVSDNERYDNIMSLYDHSRIGIVVPGKYIESVTFTPSGNLISGKVKTDASVERVDVRVNNQNLPATSSTQGEYSFSRAALSVGDYIEVITYNAAGDEVEKVSTTYPVNYERLTSISFGFYSIGDLMDSPYLFNLILTNYSPSALRFSVAPN